MLPAYFAIIGASLNFLGTIFYLISMRAGKAKPNKVTWGLWALVAGIGFVSAVSDGGGIQNATTFVAAFSPLVVFIASFFIPQSYWQTSKRDYSVVIIAVLAVLLWAITDNPKLALILAILADGIAGIPTFIKAWKFPETENGSTFLLAFIGATMALLTVSNPTFSDIAFPVYIAIATLYLTIAVYRKNLVTKVK